MNLSVIVTCEFPQVAADRLLDLALEEEGSGHWVRNAYVEGPWPEGADFASEVVTRGGILGLQHEESENPVAVTLPKLLAGLSLAVAQGALRLGGAADPVPLPYTHTEADSVLQYTAFGEIRYPRLKVEK